MFNVLRSLNLKILSLRSFIVLAVCLYYFIGMQVSTGEDVDPAFLSTYKVVFIGSIIGFFLVYFSLHHRQIVRALSTSSGIVTLAIWSILTVVLQQPSLIFILIIVLTFYDKDYKKMTGYLFLWLSFLFLLFAILASLGVISSGEILKYNLLVDLSEYESVTALGMGNPNTAMAYFLGITMAGAYVFYDTIYKMRYGLLMLALSIVVYLQVGSRTGLVCTSLFLLLYLIGTRRLASFLKALIPTIMLALIVFSIFVGIRFGQTDNPVNDLLTTRPYQWGLRIDAGALSNIIGNSDTYVTVPGDTSGSYPLDNHYVYLLARGGWLILIAVLGLYIAGSRRIKEPVIIYMIVISLIQSFVESLMFTAIVNIGMLFILSSLLFARREHKDRGNSVGHVEGTMSLNARPMVINKSSIKYGE